MASEADVQTLIHILSLSADRPRPSARDAMAKQTPLFLFDQRKKPADCHLQLPNGAVV